MKDTIKKIASAVVSRMPTGIQTSVKEGVELAFWNRHLKSSGGFYNGHFERNFTEIFGLDKAHFAGKKMLDIGCGPLGSLEWADNAAERVGVDPLAEKYLAMQPEPQQMRYVAAPAEALPFEDGHFDVVSCFNALDHVEDVQKAVDEAQRVLRPGGDLLLIVEINHPPTLTEPHFLGRDFLGTFAACDILSQRDVVINADHDVYASIHEGVAPATQDEPAIILARMQKRA